MKLETLTQFWKGLFSKAMLPGESSEVTRTPLKIRPFTKGFRLEIKVPAGARGETSAAQVTWVSAAGSHRPAKALTVLLSPN